jgi:hypothetical protein
MADAVLTPVLNWSTYVPDVETLMLTGRVLRMIGGILLHVGGLLVLLA